MMIIDPITTQAFFNHTAFLLLMLLMIWYWAGAIFYSAEEARKQFTIKNLGIYGIWVVNGSLAAVLVLRWITTSHYPLSNLYESLVFLSWSITLLQVILEKTTGFYFVGSITAPLALFLLGFATFSLPPDLQGSQPLVPALQSHWLLMHVTSMLLSYAALLAGSLFSISFLVVLSSYSNQFTKQKIVNKLKLNPDSGNLFLSNHEKLNSKLKTQAPLSTGPSIEVLNNLSFANKPISCMEIPVSLKAQANTTDTFQPSSNTELQRNSIAEMLDQLSYRTLGIGFAFLTVGILSGAVWANEAWGNYWSWDPKETWALITWIVFALYFHLRITKNWSGKGPAVMATIGFVVVWICYLGVNLLGKGLHSYGWLS